MKNTNILRSRSPLAIRLSALLLGTLAISSASAATYYWDNDGATPGFGTASGTWAEPTTGNATQGWSTDIAGTTEPVDVTTTASDIALFGTDANGLGTGTINVSGTVSAQRVDFRAASGAITLTGGTINLTTDVVSRAPGMKINSNIAISGAATFIKATNVAMTTTLGGVISGNGDVTFTNTNTNLQNMDHAYVLNGNSTYTGNTLITGSNSNTRLRVVLGVNDALPTTTVLTLDGGIGTGTSPGRNTLLQLNGKNQTIAGLKNVNRNLRVQDVQGPGTLTINNTGDFTFSGYLGRSSGALLNLVKTGSGTQTLTNSANNYAGTTTITEGRLQGVVGGDIENSAVTLGASGIYGVSITDNTKSWTCASLTTSGAGTLEFDFGSVTPSTTVSPMIITGTSGVADFTAATPTVSVLVDTGLAPGTYPLMTWDSSSGTPPSTAELTVSTVASGTAATLEVVGNTLNLVITSTASSVVKANNTDNLNLGSSWVGGTAPVPGDVAKWDSTVTSANTTVLGADVEWGGIDIANPAGLVTIGAGNTLTLGSGALDIDLSAATADLTMNCGLLLSDANIWDVNTGQTLTIGGVVSGNFPLTMKGGGTVRLGASDVLPNGSGNGNIIVDGILDLNGKAETINGLGGSGIVDNTAASTPATLTVGDNDASGTFNGILQNTGGALSLVKVGTGTLVLDGANTLTGSVAVNGGKLGFSNTAPFDNVTGISMAGGTTLRPDVVGGQISVPVTVGATGTTVTINGPSIVGGGGTSPVPVTFNAGISGDGNVSFTGIQTTNAYATVILNGASTYAGSTLVTCTGSSNTEIFVRLGTDNALPATTVLTLDGGNGTTSDRYCQVDLKGYNQTLAGLTNIPSNSFRKQQIINSDLTTAATLTINNSDPYVFSGRLGTTAGNNGSVGANFGLTKSGIGTLTLSGTNAYTGATSVNEGKLFINGDQSGAGGAVSVSGGATLGGTGTIGGDVSIADTGKLEFDISTDAASHDKLDLAATKTFTFAGSSTLTITSSGGTPATGIYTLVTAPGGITGSVPAVILPAGWVADPPAITGAGNTDLVINITTVTTGYSAWANTNAGGQGADLDFDADGVSNGVEFFMNAAAGFTANPALDGTNTITWPNGGNIPASAYGTQFVVQTSGNLATWTDVPAIDLTTNTDGPGGSLTYTLTGAAPRFVRLKVTPN